MDYSFIFIENLPEGITLSELSDIVKQKIPCDITHLLQYNTSYGLVDFRSALAHFKAPVSSASTTVYKKNPITIKNHELKLNFIASDDPFQNNFLFFNANKDIVKDAISSLIDPKLIRSIIDIPTHSIPVSVLQGTNREIILRKLKELHDIEWKPVIQDAEQFSLPQETMETLVSFEPIHDVFISFKNRKYGLIKSIASVYSKVIDKAKTNEVIELPDVNGGPIDDVVDFLWSKSVHVCFEKLPFLHEMAKFLESDQLQNIVNDYIQNKVSPLSISALAISFENAKIDEIPYDWIIPKIKEIVECPQCLYDFPEKQCPAFINKLISNKCDPNYLKVIIESLKMKKEEKMVYLEKIKTI